MTDVSNARRWTIVGLLFAAGFINYLDRAALSVALPIVSIDLRLAPAAKGVLLSAFFWSYALMQVPVGWCTDRYNLRWFYAAAFALWSVACGFTAFAVSLVAIIALRIVLGIGESVYLPGGVKTVSRLFDSRERGLASGVVNCGTRLGLALGAPLVAWLVVHYGWRHTFAIVGFGSLVWLVPWLLAVPSRTSSDSNRSATEASRDSCGAPIAALSDASGGLDKAGWRSRSLLGLCLGHLGYSYYWTLLVTWLPDYLVEARHMPLQKAGTYAVLPFLVFSVSEPLGGWVADRLIRFGWNESTVRKGIITFAFLTSLALLPIGRMGNDAAAIALIGAASMVGLATGNILALLQRIAPSGQVGLWTGILNFAGNAAGAAAPLVTGVLIGRTSSYYPGFALAVALLLAGLPAYWLVVGSAKSPATSRLNIHAQRAL